MLLGLLKSTFGFGENKVFPTYHDLDHLAGTWTEEDEKEFYENTRKFETIDQQLWK